MIVARVAFILLLLVALVHSATTRNTTKQTTTKKTTSTKTTSTKTTVTTPTRTTRVTTTLDKVVCQNNFWCDTNWTVVGSAGSCWCYALLKGQSLTWEEANNYCQDKGDIFVGDSKLVEIGSDAENDAFENWMSNQDEWYPFVWVGAKNTAAYPYKDNFFWSFDDTNLARSSSWWATGQPNNARQADNSSVLIEGCVNYITSWPNTQFTSTYGLNDDKCEKQLPFVCEFEVWLG